MHGRLRTTWPVTRSSLSSRAEYHPEARKQPELNRPGCTASSLLVGLPSRIRFRQYSTGIQGGLRPTRSTKLDCCYDCLKLNENRFVSR